MTNYQTLSNPNKTTILIVEDDPMIQLGIQKMLNEQPEYEIVDLVTDGQSAIEKTFELQPDIVLMDLALPKVDGITATQQIKTKLPNTKVIVLTCQTVKEQVLAAFTSGVDAYCIKGLKIHQLFCAFSIVQEGSIYLDPKIAHYLIHPEQLFVSNSFDFSDTDLQILNLIAEGKSNFQISKELNLSVNTIKNNLKPIFAKLSVNNRVQAALKAYRMRLIRPSL